MDGLPSSAPFLSGIDIGLWLRLIVAFATLVTAGVVAAVELG